jgi:hypothetical protein
VEVLLPDYHLYRGEQLLGTLTRTDGDMPWELGTFEPALAFEELRPLFDRELALLNADRMDEWEAAWGEIAALGLRLEPVAAGAAIDELPAAKGEWLLALLPLGKWLPALLPLGKPPGGGGAEKPAPEGEWLLEWDDVTFTLKGPDGQVVLEAEAKYAHRLPEKYDLYAEGKVSFATPRGPLTFKADKSAAAELREFVEAGLAGDQDYRRALKKRARRAILLGVIMFLAGGVPFALFCWWASWAPDPPPGHWMRPVGGLIKRGLIVLLGLTLAGPCVCFFGLSQLRRFRRIERVVEGRERPDATKGAPEVTPTPREPAPTLGWEVIASGSAGPGLRSRHGLVYDRGAKAAVLFGGIIWDARGSLQSDTWELHDRKWVRIRTPETPPARHRGAMVYLDNLRLSLLFGGQGGAGDFLGDTWTYSGRRWRRVRSGAAAPSPRCGHCLAYDEQAGVAVLFGGIKPDDTPLGDTWLFDGVSWKGVNGPSPPARRYAAFAYDPDLNGCLLHGGAEDDHGRRTFGDAWLFQDNTWKRLGRSFETDPRDDHGLGYHRRAKRLVMLEGVAGARGILVREASDWGAVEASPLHLRHQCSPLAWDDELGGLLLHGGEARHGGPQFDKTLLLRMPAAS